MYVCTCIYVYIYIYIYREREMDVCGCSPDHTRRFQARLEEKGLIPSPASGRMSVDAVRIIGRRPNNQHISINKSPT